MSLDDLGNLGEFVAAVGVVVSFFYLALQIRQNTRSIEVSSYQEANTAFQQILLVPAIYPEVARLMVKARVDVRSLSEEERVSLNGYYQAVFSSMQSVWIGFEKGTGDPELWRGTRKALEKMFQVNDVVEYWWTEAQPPFTEGFTAEVNKARNEIGST